MDETLLIISANELRSRVDWLITLRWFAVAGVFCVITVAGFLFKIHLPLGFLYAGNLLLLAENSAFSVYNWNLKGLSEKSEWFKKAYRLANFQIASDLIMLAYFIHFSGGIENPFIFFFIFHMVIASILLSRRVAFIQATMAVLFLGSVVYGEYFNIIPHYHLEGFIPGGTCLLTMKYIPGVLFIFVTTLFTTVYMATSIVKRIREGERELASANKALEEQDRLKSQYVLRVSHDIKSSLATIQICLRVVLDNLAGVISEKPKEMISRAEQRSKNLLEFVKDLLDLSRMRAARILEKEEITLQDKVDKAVSQVKSKIAKKRQKLTVEIPPGTRLIGNGAALEELLANLVQNAVKYTPEGGKITIRSREASYPNSIHISVEDTGIGIPQEDLPHIFEDFFRAANAPTMEKDGTGLGLAIAKQIVESHGGKIWAESRLGEGSEFHFILPRG